MFKNGLIALTLISVVHHGLSQFFGGGPDGARGGGGPGGFSGSDDGPPHDGGGRGEDLFDAIESMFWTNITCANSTSLPACSTLRLFSEGDEGIWVCRTTYHPITGEINIRNACVDADHALTTDVCGCCSGGCPTQCECICDLETSGDGAGVMVDFTRGNDTEITTRCFNLSIAISAVARSERATCTTNCSATISSFAFPHEHNETDDEGPDDENSGGDGIRRRG